MGEQQTGLCLWLRSQDWGRRREGSATGPFWPTFGLFLGVGTSKIKYAQKSNAAVSVDGQG
jgi:hypothetical protein